jgi:pSer/pThr/pTyr-binding forkhead associated (FHA) protein/plasmid stability protein
MVPRHAQPGPSEAKNEPRFALRFISGKYQGGEYPLAEGQEIVIGRSSELDMVLVEEMVSRKHARIALADGTINIEDLGSTNGTFVNGEKVQQGTLREGDRVLIGTNILKVVAAPQDAEARANLKAMAVGRVTAKQQPGRSTEEAPRMSGNLEEIPLPDLLQLFGTSRKAGVLVLRSTGREGRIYLNDGRIRFAEFEGVAGVPPLKALYRMLGWMTGSFALDPPDTREFEGAIDVSAQEVLMEGFRQQDELGQLRNRLPGAGRMTLKLPLAQHLRELSDEELDLLEAALTAENLDTFLDAAPGPDLESAQALLSLIQRGYLKPV